MKIEIEVSEDILQWLIDSLNENIDDNYDPQEWDVRKIEIIEYLERKQNENN